LGVYIENFAYFKNSLSTFLFEDRQGGAGVVNFFSCYLRASWGMCGWEYVWQVKSRKEEILSTEGVCSECMFQE
jgi:hypothetical protein